MSKPGSKTPSPTPSSHPGSRSQSTTPPPQPTSQEQEAEVRKRLLKQALEDYANDPITGLGGLSLTRIPEPLPRATHLPEIRANTPAEQRAIEARAESLRAQRQADFQIIERKRLEERASQVQIAEQILADYRSPYINDTDLIATVTENINGEIVTTHFTRMELRTALLFDNSPGYSGVKLPENFEISGYQGQEPPRPAVVEAPPPTEEEILEAQRQIAEASTDLEKAKKIQAAMSQDLEEMQKRVNGAINQGVSLENPRLIEDQKSILALDQDLRAITAEIEALNHIITAAERILNPELIEDEPGLPGRISDSPEWERPHAPSPFQHERTDIQASHLSEEEALRRAIAESMKGMAPLEIAHPAASHSSKDAKQAAEEAKKRNALRKIEEEKMKRDGVFGSGSSKEESPNISEDEPVPESLTNVTSIYAPPEHKLSAIQLEKKLREIELNSKIEALTPNQQAKYHQLMTDMEDLDLTTQEKQQIALDGAENTVEDSPSSPAKPEVRTVSASKTTDEEMAEIQAFYQAQEDKRQLEEEKWKQQSNEDWSDDEMAHGFGSDSDLADFSDDESNQGQSSEPSSRPESPSAEQLAGNKELGRQSPSQ